MNEYQYITTSLPSPFPFGRAVVDLNEVIRLMLRDKSSATVVVLLEKSGGNEVLLIISYSVIQLFNYSFPRMYFHHMRDDQVKKLYFCNGIFLKSNHSLNTIET